MIAKSSTERLRLFLLAGCILVLSISLVPSHVAYADTSTSDLAIRMVSAPKHAKACQVFTVTFEIANYGPDVATNLVIDDTAPDQLGVLDIQGVPATLAPGETATVIATVKVVAFVPDESRQGWIGASIYSDPYPDTSLDPNPDNNLAVQSLKFIGRRQAGCP